MLLPLCCYYHRITGINTPMTTIGPTIAW